MLQNVSKTILNETLNYLATKPLEQFDVEIIANVVRGLTKHPDVVTEEDFFKVFTLLETLSSGDVYVHQPYDTNVTNIIFEAYTNV